MIIYDNSAIEPYTNNRSYSLAVYSKHKQHYDILISEEWYIFVLQQVQRDFLPCRLFGACSYLLQLQEDKSSYLLVVQQTVSY